MDLNISGRLFVVGGATSGFGFAVTKALIAEEANVIAVARRKENLDALEAENPGKIKGVCGDISQEEVMDKILLAIGERKLDGVLVNAGGPPAMSFLETSMDNWDQAYDLILRWKVQFVKKLIPYFEKRNYGRLVFVESVSVKQPVENLVLSNSYRLAVVGFVKTLAQEIGHKGITLNILGPGYHDTPAMQRLFEKKSEVMGISVDEARTKFEAELQTGRMGSPDEFAHLAVWLLSPSSSYINGQTISVDGGLVRGVFG